MKMFDIIWDFIYLNNKKEKEKREKEKEKNPPYKKL